jgi:hypothetical protein
VIYRPGESGIPLNLQLEDGASTLYPSAYVYRGNIQEAAIPLAHVARGYYSGAWTPATSDDYTVVFVIYSDVARTLEAAQYSREAESWRPITAVSPGIADSVWDELLSGHTSPGSAGDALSRTWLIEKILRNRLELAEGSTSNWVLYDDDSVTPLLTWNVRDKAGSGILMEAHIPARRNRGT